MAIFFKVGAIMGPCWYNRGDVVLSVQTNNSLLSTLFLCADVCFHNFASLVLAVNLICFSFWSWYSSPDSVDFYVLFSNVGYTTDSAFCWALLFGFRPPWSCDRLFLAGLAVMFIRPTTSASVLAIVFGFVCTLSSPLGFVESVSASVFFRHLCCCLCIIHVVFEVLLSRLRLNTLSFFRGFNSMLYPIWLFHLSFLLL